MYFSSQCRGEERWKEIKHSSRNSDGKRRGEGEGGEGDVS
jgi:hypothetical protein